MDRDCESSGSPAGATAIVHHSVALVVCKVAGAANDSQLSSKVVRVVTLPGKCRALKRHFKNERDLLFAPGNLAWHAGQCLEPPSSQFLLPRLLPILQHQQEQPA